MDTKRNIIKGIYLGLTLVVIQKLFCVLNIQFIHNISYGLLVGSVFCLIIILFLTTDKIGNLLATGFIGLGVLIGSEIILLSTGLGQIIFDSIAKNIKYGEEGWSITYLSGFLGSVAGTVIAMILTQLKVSINLFPLREDKSLNTPLKAKLLIYALVSMISFTYLVLPENAGISVPIYAIIQLIFLWFIVPNRKRLWLYIPIFILSLNSFISGGNIWRVSNFFVSIILYSLMFFDFDFKDTSMDFLLKLLGRIIEPFKYIKLPAIWGLNVNKNKAPVIKRIVIALIITIPSVILLIAALSSADMIFSQGTQNFFKDIFLNVKVSTVLKIIFGCLVGLYLFGLLYASQFKDISEKECKNARKGDLIILNTFLVSILAIYTVFVIIQFRYLFAMASLPFGLTYTQYARKGFFELLTLTGVNIAVILLTVYLTKEDRSFGGRITKWFSCYLCGVTIVLLASSFYRMWLYNADDGLTRLRFLVFGFLIFECFGLLITFLYILKSKFNIVAVYLTIGLIYYLLLNIVPIDYYIAKSQVDRYLGGQKAGIEYITTLSTDAAPQIERLVYGNKVDAEVKSQAIEYFVNNSKFYDSFVPRWQRYNLSVEKAQGIYSKIVEE